jgi:hypothetical protein
MRAKHLIADAHGILLAVTLTGGHRNDITPLTPLVEAIRPIRAATLYESFPGMWNRAVYEYYASRYVRVAVGPPILSRGGQQGNADRSDWRGGGLACRGLCGCWDSVDPRFA